MRRRWSQRYGLPAGHPDFEQRSFAEHLQDLYEDLYFREVELEEAIRKGEDSDGDLRRQLDGIQRALAGKSNRTADDLWDRWEQDLAEGRMPDLDAMPDEEI